MKIVFTIIIVLVYIGIMFELIHPLTKGDGAEPVFALAAIIGLSYGGFKLIQYIFKKN